MRYIRYAFLATLGVVLVAVALANRGSVTLVLLPDALSDLLGLDHSISLPLFVVIFGSLIVGVLIGFVWEWLREHKHRSGKTRAERELAKTQRDLRRVKGKQSEGKDEVLALLDEAS
ncbi:lipopolysaccharide assembly protein LapA domain-containing protein [Shimia biformata]|uniref:lipopolysaccharide assembly protein LapA domain-containing protein n=1 Tax=Shimia biformata TaxID=1294299 RepID=UPI00195098C7|nr:LapA family protein [Shimia biformata]